MSTGLAYAFRQMRLSPVFTLTAMLILALGIGAATAFFSLIDSAMLKSLRMLLTACREPGGKKLRSREQLRHAPIGNLP